MQSVRKAILRGRWLLFPFNGGRASSLQGAVSFRHQWRSVAGSAAPKEVLHPDFEKEFRGREDHFPCLAR